MLKPFADRVKSTYALMQSIIETANQSATTIKKTRRQSIAATQQQQDFPLSWKVDSSRSDQISFL